MLPQRRSAGDVRGYSYSAQSADRRKHGAAGRSAEPEPQQSRQQGGEGAMVARMVWRRSRRQSEQRRQCVAASATLSGADPSAISSHLAHDRADGVPPLGARAVANVISLVRCVTVADIPVRPAGQQQAETRLDRRARGPGQCQSAFATADPAIRRPASLIRHRTLISAAPGGCELSASRPLDRRCVVGWYLAVQTPETAGASIGIRRDC